MTPPWERSLGAMVALHDLAVAGYELTGNAAAVESARLEVVAVIDRAMAAGVPEASIDAALSRLTGEREAPRDARGRAPYPASRDDPPSLLAEGEEVASG